jgi:hypothetical protein
MTKRRVRRLVAAAAGIVTMAGVGVVASAAVPALAGTATTSYVCSGISISGSVTLPLTLTTPASAVSGSSTSFTISTAAPTATLDQDAISSWQLTGVATTTVGFLDFGYAGGSLPAEAGLPAFTITEPFTMPASGSVQVTMPENVTLTIDAITGGTYTCSATGTPGSDTITATSPTASTATAEITSVSGESGTGAARDGSTVSFTGSGFSANDTVYVALVPSGATTASTLGSPLTADRTGTVSGSVSVPSSTAAGAYLLALADAADVSATVPLTILGAPSCSASPDSGGAGTAVTVTCANFDPSASLGVQGMNIAGEPTSDNSTSATSDSSGNVLTTYTVNDSSTTGIEVSETEPEDLSATAPFSFTTNSGGNGGNGGGGNSGTGSTSGSQTVTTTVSSGPLDMVLSGSQVTLSGITIDGTPQSATGSLNQIQVQDFRAGTLGWTLNATATDFAGSNGGSISASALTVTPTCVPDDAALTASGLSAFPSTVTAGATAAMGSAVTLCSAPAATSGGLTGGVFDAGGGLSLEVPAFLSAGTYTGSITLSLG